MERKTSFPFSTSPIQVAAWRRLATKFLCLKTTPLGGPEVPLVYRMNASSSGLFDDASKEDGAAEAPKRKSLNKWMLGFFATLTFMPRPRAASENKKSLGKGR